VVLTLLDGMSHHYFRVMIGISSLLNPLSQKVEDQRLRGIGALVLGRYYRCIPHRAFKRHGGGSETDFKAGNDQNILISSTVPC
jgi:hypothetical protein